MEPPQEPLLEGIIEIDVTGTVVWANDVAARLLVTGAAGATGGEPVTVGAFIADRGPVISEDGRPLPVGELAVVRCLASGQEVGPQLQGIATPAGRQWVTVIARPRRDESGVVVGAVVHLVDATELVEASRRLRAVLDTTTDAIVVMRPDTGVVLATPAFTALFGRPATMSDMASGAELLHPDDLPAAIAAREAMLNGGTDRVTVTYRTRHGDGSWVWVEQTSQALRDESGRVEEVHSVFRDVTAERAARDRLQASEEHYRLLAENTLDVILRTDLTMQPLYVSPAVTAVFGYRPEEVPNVASLVHPEDAEPFSRRLVDLLAGRHVSYRLRIRHADGDWRDVDVAAAPVHGDGGEVVGLQGRVSDVTEQVRAQRAKAAADARWRAVFDHGPAGQAVVTREGRTVEINAALRRMTGRRTSDLGSKAVALEGIHDDDRARVADAFDAVAAGRSRHVELEARVVDASGRVFWALLSMAPVAGEGPLPDDVIVQMLDIDAMVRHREGLLHDASHDTLTGLVNRAAIEAAIGDALRTCPAGQSVVVCFVDLDGFKETNDRLGHAAGDRLLAEAAQRLSGAARRDDLVGRYGGDEFLVLGRGLAGVEGARSLAVRLAEAFEQPMGSIPEPMRMSASVGAVVAGPSASVAEVIAVADATMYAAKRRGPGHWQVASL